MSATPRQADRGVAGAAPSRSHARRPAGAARWLRVLALVVLASGCVAAPPASPRMPSQALEAGAGSALGRVGATLLPPEGGVDGSLPAPSATSSLLPLAAGADAWAARLMLVEQAELGLDLQYYIFRPDASGRALLAALRRAADRGVRVRLLLDDWGAKPDLATLRALATHPRIAVRLYNPLAHAGSTLLSLLFDFEGTQRRMHNKLLVADGRAAIVGGRNIGDEYFERRPGFEFGDLDMLAFGAVVPQFAAGFDRFWNEAPVAVLDGAADAATAAAPPPAVAGSPGDAGADEGDAAWRGFAARLNAGTLPRYRAAAQAVQDLPDKADPERDADTHHLGQEISRVMGDVRSELLLVSPYFVPGEGGVEQLRALRRRGVRVVVVTNSLAATDVPAVHAGYARYRKALLEAGVELHELRADTAPRSRPHQGVGSSRVSLHAKVMVVDRAHIFVGSMNIDPRSTRLNSENGVVVGSVALAGDVATGLQRALADSAWRVALQQGRLAWQGRREGVPVTLDDEPGAGLWLRMQASVLSWLPIERLL